MQETDDKPKQETLGNKVKKIGKTLASAGEKIVDAIQEEKRKIHTLSCVQQECLDYSLIEKDIGAIHQQLEQNGSITLGSYITLDDKKDLMKIEIYTKQDEKTFVNKMEMTVHNVENIPEDVNAELKDKGFVKLFLKPDD